jgi:hypothetical protein
MQEEEEKSGRLNFSKFVHSCSLSVLSFLASCTCCTSVFRREGRKEGRQSIPSMVTRSPQTIIWGLRGKCFAKNVHKDVHHSFIWHTSPWKKITCCAKLNFTHCVRSFDEKLSAGRCMPPPAAERAFPRRKS